MVSAAALVMILVPGCGALAPDATPASPIPTSGSGPYRSLDTPEPLLQDRNASLDDPFLLVEGEALTLYYTRRGDDGTVRIDRARFASLDDKSPVLDTALSADRQDDSGAVSQPSLLDLGDGHLLLTYTTGRDANGFSSIGYAVSTAGGPFVKADHVAKRPKQEFTEPLSSSAALLLDDGSVRLLWLDGDHLDGSDGRLSSVIAPDGYPWMNYLPAHPWIEGRFPVGRFTARTVQLPTGRRRFDLFFTRPGSVRSLGFAASYDGLAFTTAAAPLLPVAAPEEWAPTGAGFRDGTLLVYARSVGPHSALFVAQNP